MITRRRFLRSGAGLVLGVAPRLLAQPRAHFERNPFGLGIASGSPTPTGVVLWTRIAPEPLAPLGGVNQATVPVRWEIARDENMRDVVQRGTAAATADWGYSVHVEVNGLEPNRWYFYHFLVDDAASPIGRTRTALAPDRTLERLRIVVGSCQHYEHGYFDAYRHIVADNPDLVVFLGDYIYETNTADDDVVRRHNAPEPRTLADYRTRYALYRSDPNLQAAHASCPWVVTWDDHEVVNNYANDWALRNDQRKRFLRRRAAAYQAFYEHMPLPRASAPREAAMRLHARHSFGKLLSLHVLDGRQYRSRPACAAGGDRLGPECVERVNPERTYLGWDQERWLEEGLKTASARWNFIAQPTLFAPFDRQLGPATRFDADGWDGYPAARARLLRALATHRPSNPVFIGGDLHAFFVAEIRQDFDVPKSPMLASEFVTTSISARYRTSPERLAKLHRESPHLLFADGTKRGYVRMDITEKELRVDLRVMGSVATPKATCHTAASFRVQDGVPGPVRVG